MTTINGQRIKVLGEWDGLTIWRFVTASEVLAEELKRIEDEKQGIYKIKIKINDN